MSATYSSEEIGPISVAERDGAIVGVRLGQAGGDERSELLDEALAQLAAYFAGTLTAFDLPLAPAGSPFQKAVYDAMLRIPFGDTMTYGEIASALDSPAQPVGQACGSNPIALIIPCHRVVGASGLGGFSAAGGVDTKVALLRHEGAYGLLI